MIQIESRRAVDEFLGTVHSLLVAYGDVGQFISFLDTASAAEVAQGLRDLADHLEGRPTL